MATPRVLPSQLKDYAGKVVRVVGTVVHIDQAVYMLRDEEGCEAKVVCKGVPRFNQGIVEAIGRVQPDGSVEEYTSAQFAPGFDFAMYREAVQQTQRFPGLFPVAG